MLKRRQFLLVCSAVISLLLAPVPDSLGAGRGLPFQHDPSDPPAPDAKATLIDIDTADVIVRRTMRPGKAGSVADSNAAAHDEARADTGPPDPCFYLPLGADKAAAAGHDPKAGTLFAAHCPVSSMVPGLPDGLRWVIREVWSANGAPPVAPAPDPVELAQSAAAQIKVPAPVVHVGPRQDRIAVKVPVWLWVDDQPARTVSVSAGGLTVTASASLTSTDWSMGEPVDDPGRSGGARVSSFTCEKRGVEPPAVVDPTVVPLCGYTYQWRSTAERTGGARSWHVMTVAHWTLHWVATNGQRGDIPLQATSDANVNVGEWRASLVAGQETPQPTR